MAGREVQVALVLRADKFRQRLARIRMHYIVVIRDPGDHGLSVKRVIAVPGESVLFKDGKVFVNGKQLKEPYLSPDTLTFTYSQAKEQFITCGKDQYFVLGDNRLRSIDSRAYGAVSRDDLPRSAAAAR